jgi:putative NIF3 family GTP cyclohydrolase 1 type 2
MNVKSLSRREFTQLTVGGLLTEQFVRAQAARPTARQVVERIQKNVGVPWRAQTVDTFKAGNPDAPIKGIATCFMSTLDTLQRAVIADKDFIVTHEPTYWNAPDNLKGVTDDPLYKQKTEFIDKNHLVIWRFHDHLHAQKPDMIFEAFHRTLGWQKYQVGDNNRLYDLPETTLEKLAIEVRGKLKTRSLRVIGNSGLKVKRVGHGAHDIVGNIRALQNVDALLIGEAIEYDSFEYFRDTVTAGQNKGAILLAHEVVEEWGMDDCAVWLRTFIPEVPIEWIPSGEPFWAPV